MDHLWPRRVQFPVLFYKPCRFIRFDKVRRIENDKGKSAVIKRKRSEIALNVWMYMACME